MLDLEKPSKPQTVSFRVLEEITDAPDQDKLTERKIRHIALSKPGVNKSEPSKVIKAFSHKFFRNAFVTFGGFSYCRQRAEIES